MDNPVNSFLQGMQATSGIIRARKQEDRDERRFDMQMARQVKEDAYVDGVRSRADQFRQAAADLSRIENGGMTAEDVGKYVPDASVKMADLTPGVAAEEKERAGINQFNSSMAKAYQGGDLSSNEKETILEGGAALATTGHLFSDLSGIRNQAASSTALKDSIRRFGDAGAGQLLGKKTVIDAANHPDLFAQFSHTFPAVSRSKAFKEGAPVQPVQFYIDGEGAKSIQDVKIFTVLEGQDKEGKIYRAPMSVKRTSDPDDVVEGVPLGEVYARADLAERASKSIMAAVAGLNDGEAQKVIDRHRSQAEKLAERKREIDQVSEFMLDPDVAGLVAADKSGVLKLGLQAVKSGTTDAKTFLGLTVKRAAESYQEKQDEESAQSTIGTLYRGAQALGGRFAAMGKTLAADVQTGKFATAKDALAAHKELMDAALKLDVEEKSSAATVSAARLKAADGMASHEFGANGSTAPIKNAKYLEELAAKNDRAGAIRFLISNSLIRQKNDYVQEAVKLARESNNSDLPFDAKVAESEAKAAWDGSVDEMLISAGFLPNGGQTIDPSPGRMEFAPSHAVKGMQSGATPGASLPLSPTKDISPTPSSSIKANKTGDKVTVGGKQYQSVNGIVTIDGKKYRVQ